MRLTGYSIFAAFLLPLAACAGWQQDFDARFAAASAASASGNPNLVGWWKLDGSGADSSGYGNTGTLIGSPTNAPDHNGTANGAIGFNGSSQYVSLTKGASLNITSRPLTLAAWVRSESANSGYVLSCNGATAGTMQYGMVWASGTTPTLYLNGSTRLTASTPLSLNAWHHVAFVWADNGVPIYYVNGSSNAVSTAYTGTLTPRANASIGRRSNSEDGSASAVLFQGQIDDVRVYKQALTPAQITTVMNGGQP